jgi:hypothetical protein
MFSNEAVTFLAKFPVVMLDVGHANDVITAAGVSTEMAMLQLAAIKKLGSPALVVGVECTVSVFRQKSAPEECH